MLKEECVGVCWGDDSTGARQKGRWKGEEGGEKRAKKGDVEDDECDVERERKRETVIRGVMKKDFKDEL